MRRTFRLAALAALPLAAGCGGSVERIGAERYWQIKRSTVAPVEEVLNPRTGDLEGRYWMGRLEKPTFRVSKGEVDAFREANPRLVEEAEAHARGVADGYAAGRRMADPYNPGFTPEPRPPYRDARLAGIYKAAWQLGRQYGFEAKGAFPAP